MYVALAVSINTRTRVLAKTDRGEHIVCAVHLLLNKNTLASEKKGKQRPFINRNKFQQITKHLQPQDYIKVNILHVYHHLSMKKTFNNSNFFKIKIKNRRVISVHAETIKTIHTSNTTSMSHGCSYHNEQARGTSSKRLQIKQPLDFSPKNNSTLQQLSL